MKAKIFVLFSIYFMLLIISCNKKNQNVLPKATWQKVETPYFGKPIQIEFTNSDTGYILGQDTTTLNSILAKTNNGGQTWSVIKFSKQFLLDTAKGDFTKVTPSNKNSNLLFSGSNNILRSYDGGLNWEIMQSATVTLSPPASVYYYFVGESDIVAVGENAYKSVDGGNSWNTVYEPDAYFSTLQSLKFTSNLTGYAAGGTAYDASNYGTLIKTTDGGSSWENIDYPLGQSITGLSFINDEVGFINISLYHGSQAATYSNGSALYETQDGGKSWKVVNSNIELPNYDIISKIYFQTERDGFGIGSNIYHTTDGGKTWQMENPSQNGKLYFVSFPNTSYCYVVDYYGNVFKRKL